MTEDTNDTSTTEDNSKGSQTDTSQDNKDGATQDEPTFTQEQVNALMGKTRKDARSTTEKQFLDSLGIENIDAIKAILDDNKKRKDAEMSEVEKAQAKIDELNQQLEQEKQARLQAEQQRVQIERNGVIAAALQTAGSQHPEDLILIAESIGVSFASAWSENGALDQKGLDKAVADLRSKRPSAFTPTTPGSPSNSGGSVKKPGEMTKQDKQEMKNKHGKL